VRICSATFFSKFERTLTEYQRFAMPHPPYVSGGEPPEISMLSGTQQSAQLESLRARVP
jgi:hypothetical protein